MNEYLRELLAEEQGLCFCAITNRYECCDLECDKCYIYKEFEEILFKESEQEWQLKICLLLTILSES